MPGTLYVVATPIGNLEDITLRALRVLREADLIAAEDTRHTRKLLSHFQIETPTASYHQHSGEARTAHLLARMTENNQSIALVTDAGTPGVSDPGSELIEAAIGAGVAVVPLPGASAILCALIGSGLPLTRFAFEGFLPRTKAPRRERLQALASEPRTLVFYEAGNRTADTLRDLSAVFGPERPAAVARELTKAHEEFARGPLHTLAARFQETPARGEVTLVVAGMPDADAAPTAEAETPTLTDALQTALARGLSERDAVRLVSQELRLSRREVYAALIARKNSP